MEGAVLPCGEPVATQVAGEDVFLSREAPALHPDKQILVLNRNWQAVSIVGVKRAFALLFRDHARIINPDSGEHALFDIYEWIDYSVRNPPKDDRDALRTVRTVLRIPEVMILSNYDKLPMKEVRLSHKSIFDRDEHTCQYCGKKFRESELSIDHVIPRERGGRNTWENLVTACLQCNARKANRLPHEAGMHLLHKPRRPPKLPFAATAFAENEMMPRWRAFLQGY